MRLIFTALALAALASPAFAEGVWTAVPAQPAPKAMFTGQNVTWACTASGCQTTSDTSDADGMAECRQLAQQLGALSSFASPKAFSADRLSACNKSARK